MLSPCYLRSESGRMLYRVFIVLTVAVSRAAAVSRPQLLIPAVPNVTASGVQNLSLSLE